MKIGLVSPFDALGIASACNRPLANPAPRERLAKQGRALVFRRFSIKGRIGAYEAVYARMT